MEGLRGNVLTLANALPEFRSAGSDIRWGVRNEEIVPADSYAVEIGDRNVTITFRDMAELKAGYYYVNVVDAGAKYRSPSLKRPCSGTGPWFVIDSA